MEGVFVFDKDLRCVFANRVALNQIGAGSLRGRRPWDFKPRTKQQQLERLFRAAAQKKAPQRFKTWHKHDAGFLFPVEIQLRYENEVFMARAKMQGVGLLADMAGGIELEADEASPKASANLRYYAAVLRALSLGYGADSVLSPDRAESMFTASAWFSGDNP